MLCEAHVQGHCQKKNQFAFKCRSLTVSMAPSTCPTRRRKISTGKLTHIKIYKDWTTAIGTRLRKTHKLSARQSCPWVPPVGHSRGQGITVMCVSIGICGHRCCSDSASTTILSPTQLPVAN